MAGKNDTLPAQRRNAVISTFTAAIQSVEPVRKAALGQRLAQLQTDLVGTDGATASQLIVAAILSMKNI